MECGRRPRSNAGEASTDARDLEQTRRYLTSAAKYQATEKVENARLLGLKTLYTKLGLEAEAHKASMDYLLTLMDATETKDYVDFDPVGTVAA